MGAGKLTRRRLLEGAGAAAAALPFLRTLPSAAQPPAFPTRFVVFFSPNEAIRRVRWAPPGADPGSRQSLSGSSFRTFLEPLGPYADRIVMIGDLTMQTAFGPQHQTSHNQIGHMLTGVENIGSRTGQSFWAGGKSLDQEIADRWSVEALTVAAKPLNRGGKGRISYRGANQPVHPIIDPMRAFEQVFGNVGETDAERTDRIARRRSIFDAVAGRLGALRSRLPSVDRYKLEAHLEELRALERSLDASPVSSCAHQAPEGDYDYNSDRDYPVTARRHIDVIVQALACDTTRVASVALGQTGGSVTPAWPEEGINIGKSEHNIAHDGRTSSGLDDHIAMSTWNVRQFKYLLDQLSAVPEGDGTLLDNCLVLWCKPMGYAHRPEEMLYMLAGSAGGALETGRFVSFPDAPHNDLLVSILQILGFDDTNYGDPAFCTGSLSL